MTHHFLQLGGLITISPVSGQLLHSLLASSAQLVVANIVLVTESAGKQMPHNRLTGSRQCSAVAQVRLGDQELLDWPAIQTSFN